MPLSWDGVDEDGNSVEDQNVNFTTGWDRPDYDIAKIEDNPGLALYKLHANFYKFSWLLIPIFGAVCLVAVLLYAPVQDVRPYGLRHLFAGLHVAVRDRVDGAGLCRGRRELGRRLTGGIFI